MFGTLFENTATFSKTISSFSDHFTQAQGIRKAKGNAVIGVLRSKGTERKADRCKIQDSLLYLFSMRSPKLINRRSRKNN